MEILRQMELAKKKNKGASVSTTNKDGKNINFDCDIVNLHWIGNEMISIDQINKINKPLVCTFWDMWPFCGAEHYTNNKRYEEGYNKNMENQLIHINHIM